MRWRTWNIFSESPCVEPFLYSRAVQPSPQRAHARQLANAKPM